MVTVICINIRFRSVSATFVADLEKSLTKVVHRIHDQINTVFSSQSDKPALHGESCDRGLVVSLPDGKCKHSKAVSADFARKRVNTEALPLQLCFF